MLIKTLMSLVVSLGLVAGAVHAKTPAQLNDLEIAHVAYTADVVDIRYAHLALAISKNPAIHKFARTMIRDHGAVNVQALALLKKLKVQAVDNTVSRGLNTQSDQVLNKLSKLRGAAFDRAYALNELRYHRAVNKLVEFTFIPRIKNPQVKALFKQALAIFKAHEHHAEMMVRSLDS